VVQVMEVVVYFEQVLAEVLSVVHAVHVGQEGGDSHGLPHVLRNSIITTEL